MEYNDRVFLVSGPVKIARDALTSEYSFINPHHLAIGAFTLDPTP